mmetsp:Transcript_111930/g.281691  ORF Transcript_111930/g.281691 Transcript_111930/m.281691 type:complete len:200 (-) Transcript_111930:818-1417(-)
MKGKPENQLLPFRILGALIFCVGGGNCARLPLKMITGLQASGTVSCITGLFLYRSTSAGNPCWRSFHATEQTLSLCTAHPEKPSRCSRRRSASAGETKFTKAWFKPVSVSKSTGKYAKSYLPAKPSESSKCSKPSRVKPSGKFRNMTVVRGPSKGPNVVFTVATPALTTAGFATTTCWGPRMARICACCCHCTGCGYPA